MPARTSIDIPAVVINLARSRDRRTHMEAQLRGRGLNYHFLEATDGAKLTPAERALYDEQAALRFGRKLTKGEIGCALSHARVYEWMVQTRRPRLLVLEDDACLDDEFFTTLTHADKWLPHKWGLINFYDGLSSDLQEGASPMYRYMVRVNAIPHVPAHYLYYFTKSHHLSTCYLIHLSAAERLLSLAYPIRMTADLLTGFIRYNGLDCYTILPRLVHILPTISTMDEFGVRTWPAAPAPSLWHEIKWFIGRSWELMIAYLRFAPRYPMARAELVQRVACLIRQAPHKFYQKVVRQRIGALFSNRPLS